MTADVEPMASCWPDLPVQARCRHIGQLRMIIAKRHRQVAQAVSAETGRPITEVVNQEVTAVLEMLRFLEGKIPGWLREERFRYWRPGFWAKANAVRLEPLGMILIIGPGNFPFSLPVMQAAAALLCGNRIVIKPSERCPAVTDLIREVFEAAQLGSGTVEVVAGGPEIAHQLILREDVRKVIFTGSCRAGRSVAEVCGRAFKPCVLELGGGSSAIVCEDADLSLAARGIAWSAFYANGNSCVGTRRVFVRAEKCGHFIELLTKEMAGIKTGDPNDPVTEVGISAAVNEESTIREWLEDALSRGAQVWSKNGAVGDLRSVDFRLPLAVTRLPLENPIFQADKQSPLLAVREVASDEQAVREMNQGAFGLGASIWSRDTKRARAIAAQMQAGMVWINDSSVGLPQFPWGGVKQSGWGRMFSRYGMVELTNVKVISSERQWLSRSKIWWFPYSKEKAAVFENVNSLYSNPLDMGALKRLLSALLRLSLSMRRRN